MDRKKDFFQHLLEEALTEREHMIETDKIREVRRKTLESIIPTLQHAVSAGGLIEMDLPVKYETLLSEEGVKSNDKEQKDVNFFKDYPNNGTKPEKLSHIIRGK